MVPIHKQFNPVHILKTRVKHILIIYCPRKYLTCFTVIFCQPMQFAKSSQILHFLHCTVRLMRRPDSESEGKFMCAKSSQMLHFLHCAVRLVCKPDNESEEKFMCARNTYYLIKSIRKSLCNCKLKPRCHYGRTYQYIRRQKAVCCSLLNSTSSMGRSREFSEFERGLVTGCHISKKLSETLQPSSSYPNRRLVTWLWGGNVKAQPQRNHDRVGRA
jgi:hypothetical protein